MLPLLSLASCTLGIGLIFAGERSRSQVVALETLGGGLLLFGLAILGAALGVHLPITR
jgi:Na+/phosphate symporter